MTRESVARCVAGSTFASLLARRAAGYVFRNSGRSAVFFAAFQSAWRNGMPGFSAKSRSNTLAQTRIALVQSILTGIRLAPSRKRTLEPDIDRLNQRCAAPPPPS